MAKKKKATKKKWPYSGPYYRGFKKTNIPGDSGYVKHLSDGSRLHKRSKNGPVHKDKYDPVNYPVQHVVVDFLLRDKTKKKKRKKKWGRLFDN